VAGGAVHRRLAAALDGLTFVLENIARQPEWAVLAVVLNSFLATGMILAAMLFYRDRARVLGLPSLQEGA